MYYLLEAAPAASEAAEAAAVASEAAPEAADMASVAAALAPEAADMASEAAEVAVSVADEVASLPLQAERVRAAPATAAARMILRMNGIP